MNIDTDESRLTSEQRDYLATARAFAEAIRRHDAPAVHAGVERLRGLRVLRRERHLGRPDPDWAAVNAHVAVMVERAELHAAGLPFIEARGLRAIAVYPERTPAFDPFPELDFGRIETVCDRLYWLEAQWVRARIVEQARAARARGDAFEVDLDDPAQASWHASIDSVDQVPPGRSAAGFLGAVADTVLAYYDIVCAPKTIDMIT